MKVLRFLPSVRGARISFSAPCLAACLLLLSISLTPQVRAQGLSGISGTVTDPSGAVVPEAKGTATNTATGVASHATTTSVGSYIITDLIPGTYTVRVEQPGFAAAVKNGVTVDVSRTSTVAVALTSG